MKQLLLGLISLACCTASAQNFSLSADKNNVLYIGVDNPLSIVVEGYSSDDIIVKADKGEVFGSGRFRIFHGFQPGNTWITLSSKKDLREIGRSLFRVKFIPDPVARVGSLSGGNISKSILQSQTDIRAELDNSDYNVMFFVDSFAFHFIPADSCYQNVIVNTGNKFNKIINAILGGVKKNDIVIFKNIYARGPDGRALLLPPIVFTITD